MCVCMHASMCVCTYMACRYVCVYACMCVLVFYKKNSLTFSELPSVCWIVACSLSSQEFPGIYVKMPSPVKSEVFSLSFSAVSFCLL